jgi:hypothetical protein
MKKANEKLMNEKTNEKLTNEKNKTFQVRSGATIDEEDSVEAGTIEFEMRALKEKIEKFDSFIKDCKTRDYSAKAYDCSGNDKEEEESDKPKPKPEINSSPRTVILDEQELV